MERRMEYRPAIEVFVNESGGITIKAEEMGGDQVIALQPEQVPTVIQWLQECLTEIENDLPDEDELLQQEDDEKRKAAAERAAKEGWEYNAETGEYVDKQGVVRDRYGNT